MSSGGDEGGSKNNSNMFKKKNYRRENKVTVDVLDDWTR